MGPFKWRFVARYWGHAFARLSRSQSRVELIGRGTFFFFVCFIICMGRGTLLRPSKLNISRSVQIEQQSSWAVFGWIHVIFWDILDILGHRDAKIE